MSKFQCLNSNVLILVGPVLSRPLTTEALNTFHLNGIPQVAVDGGEPFAIQPEWVVGDGDSRTGQSSGVFQEKQSQDLTDLSHALKLLSPGNWTELHLFGFMGGRKDHELAAIGEVCRALALRMDLTRAVFYSEMISENAATVGAEAHSFTVASSIHNIGTHAFDHRGTFSILAFESARFTIAGACQYLIRDQVLLPFSGAGVSNVGQGTFTVQSSGVFMMIPSQERT